MPEVKLHLFGAPYLELDGEPVALDTRKAIALLAYCATTAAGGAQSHTRDALSALLWPDLDQSRARAALRRTLSPLRQAVDRKILDVTRETIGIRPDAPLWVDAVAFRRLLSDAPSPPERRQRLQQAIALFGDDFMAGFTLRDAPDFDEWQYFESQQLRRLLAEALEQLTGIYVQVGDFEEAIPLSHRHLSLDPLSEQAHRHLMQLYAWSGQRSLAVRQYRECVRVLEQELGVAPLEETTALYEMILADELPDRPQTADRGPQIAAKHRASHTTEHTPHAAVRRPPSAVDLLPLTGRAHELARMQAVYDLARESGHFLVIEGEAGVGKTRLAQEFVAQAPGRLLQARCYEGEAGLTFSPFITALRQGLEKASIELTAQDWREPLSQHWLAEAARLVPELDLSATPPAPLSGPGAQSRFFESVCRVLLALAADGDRRSLTGFQKPVRSSQSQPGILFLDDVHWADDASLDLLTYLVKRLATYQLIVLVTCRSGAPTTQRLQALLSGARRSNAATHISLQRLSAEHVKELVEASGLQSPGNAFARRLYRQTEGLPFFIVEYLKSAPESQLAQDQTTASEGDAHDSDEAGLLETPATFAWESPESTFGQRPPVAVRSLIEERLQDLDEVSRQLLNAAAVIGRSFNFDICRLASGRSEEEAVAALEALLARGLIEEVPATATASSQTPPAPQYDFSHNQIRALVYGQTNLARRRLLHRRVAEALVQAPSRSLHVTGYGGISGQIAHHYRLAGQDTQAAEYFKRAAEHARELYANRAALAHVRAALDLGHPDVAALHEASGDLHILLGEYGDALSSYQAAAAHGEAHDLARLEHKLGNVHDRRGDWRMAQSHYEAALAQARAVSGDGAAPAIQARIYSDFSLAAHRQGQEQEALALADEARRFAGRAEDDAASAQAHNILGILARHAGDLTEAQRHLQKSLHLATASGHPAARIAALNNLALVYGDMQSAGDEAMHKEARATLEEALHLCQKLGDRHREAALLNNLADLHHAAGRPDQAMGHLKRAATIFAEIGGDKQEWQPEIWKLTEW